MKKHWDIVVTQRYTDRDGAEKKRYVNIGKAFDGDKGISLKLDSVPLGWDGWAGLYEPKPKQSREEDPGSPPF